MTQDVQPLTWQKRTNLEEHQQFFSKINEIIDNLAPTVDEAEAAIAQATAAIASANDAIATANAASAAASAAASQAQTAANTVAGYDTRLTAAEDDIDSLQAADQTMAGNISALGTRMTAAETKNSQQDTAIAALQTADGQNVKISRINDYAVGLTGNQSNIGGIKGFVNGISAYPTDWHNTFASEGNTGDIKLFAKLNDRGAGRYLIMELIESSNNALCYGVLGIHNIPTPVAGANGWMVRKGYGGNNPLAVDSILVVTDGTDVYLASRKKVVYGNLNIRVRIANNYAFIDTNPTPQIEWLSNYVNIGDGTGYTLVEMME